MISSFLLFQLIIFFVQIKAQHLSENTIPSPDDSVSNFQPSLPVVIGMLAVMFSFTFVLLLYAKFCHHVSGSATSHHIHDGLVRSRGEIPPLGVDKTVVESLPFFRFSSLKGSKRGLECAVCLAKFEAVEILRLLPKCKHAFHIDCIDTWLEKHTTCPLCRSGVCAGDLSDTACSTSLRWNEDSNVEVYVASRPGSSRFSLCSSFRKIDDDDILPIPRNDDHEIIVSVFKNRWSNVTSSDLVVLNSEMLNYESTSRLSRPKEMDPIEFPGGSGFGSTARLDPNEKRSMSEIVIHSRYSELRNQDCLSGEERMRRLWVPIARKTVRWFTNRDTRTPQSQGLNLQISNV